MRKTRLIWQLFPFHVLILLGAILAITWYGSRSFRQFSIEQMAANLSAQARLIEPQATGLLLSGRSAALQELCRQSAEKTATRITLIDRQGLVVCDSAAEPQQMENHAQRPEIMAAFAGRPGIAQRSSTTTGQEMLYVAVPLMDHGEVRGALRSAIPLTFIDEVLGRFFSGTAAGVILVVILAAAMTLAVARKVSRPLAIMRQGILRFAGGDFSRAITVSAPEELVDLAQAMNKMAAQLDDRIRAVESQRNELETVVASMVEGVMAVDRSEKLLYMNSAAAQQLGLDEVLPQGENILKWVRNIELQRMLQETLSEDDPIEGTIVFARGRKEERILQVYGAQLQGARGERIGALIVTNDVTRLLRLERLRRDFVANVSHELKTPITAIKGYVETLQEEAAGGPRHVRDFLEIISRHANRLQLIVEDLLTLSRIEQQGERGEISLAEGNLKEVLQAAIEACGARAAAKSIEINLQCPDELTARINGPLLEQALINLIDNAVKYSEPEKIVYVEAKAVDPSVLLQVRDSGPGIAAEHLDRIFERFYIVDKARSRKLGGTGLGLAIVKHIAQAHAGQASVQSEPGQGSTFTIAIPVGG